MDQAGRQITVDCDGDTRIVVLPAKLSQLANIDVLTDFDNLAVEFKRDAIKQVVIDFSRITYFGSGMLEALLLLWKQLTARDGKMVLCHVSEVGLEILSISRFDTVWPICATRAEAIQAVRSL